MFNIWYFPDSRQLKANPESNYQKYKYNRLKQKVWDRRPKIIIRLSIS